MRWKDNIYFYISIATLTFIFVLVGFFYEKKFEMTDFLDAKTIVLALGTIIGAYLGASKAGEYSVKVMLKQQRLLKEEQLKQGETSKNRYKKYLLTNSKNVIQSIDFLIGHSESEHAGYLKSLEREIADIKKIEMIFDNLNYLLFDEELIPKYLDIQYCLGAIVSISNILKNIHESFEESYKQGGIEKIHLSPAYVHLETVKKQLRILQKDLRIKVNEIENK